MKIPYYHVDAFAQNVFEGNPAGVCLLESWSEDALLQRIAAENNLPETAFIVRNDDLHQLRWFTPETEIDLCGHATLASAYVLHVTSGNHPVQFEFETRSGTLTVEKKDNLFIMDFPARKPKRCAMPDALKQGLGATPNSVYRARDLLAVFDSEQHIRELAPDFQILKTLGCFGIIATAPGDNVDFVSRFFAPGAGIPEDPVTGSSHCTLIPYWSGILGKNELTARQLSQRGGELFCCNNGERVHIGGHAVLYHSGSLTV